MSDSDEVVMYLIVRNDLGMSPGKVAAQVGHGVELALARIPLGQHEAPCAKIVLQASKQEIADLFNQNDYRNMFMVKVFDEGRTEVPPDSLTVVACVPTPKNLFQDKFKHLRLYR